MIGTLEMAPRFRLSQHEIAQMICQVRFSEVLRLLQREALIPFQEAIRETYPRFAQRQATNILVTPQGVSHTDEGDPEWQFDDASGRFRVTLATDFLALETREYVDIDEFSGRLRELVDAVAEHYAPPEATRLGVRFINEFRLGSQNARAETVAVFHPSLLGPLAAPELTEAVTASRQLLEFETETNRLTVRHGLHLEGGSTVEQNERATIAISQPFYLLDIDAFIDGAGPFDSDVLEARVRAFNDQIRTLFAWAVNETYRHTRLGQEDL